MTQHPFEKTTEGGPVVPRYEELSNIIDLEDTSLSFMCSSYADHELDVLQLRLMALGYTEIVWSTGDVDAFGPLTRICTCRDAAGEIRTFIYG